MYKTKARNTKKYTFHKKVYSTDEANAVKKELRDLGYAVKVRQNKLKTFYDVFSYRKYQVNYGMLSPRFILSFLKRGMRLTFPNGYYFEGDPTTNYIQLGSPYGKEGLYILNMEGVKFAINDARKFEDEQTEEED